MKEKIIDKLRKLLAHAASAKSIGNQAEAEAFAAKAQELLDEHNLSMSDVEIEAEKSVPVDREFVGARRRRQQWEEQFLGTIAHINGCRSLGTPFGYVIVVGREVDRTLTIEIYKYFEKLARHFADQHGEAFKQTGKYQRARKKMRASKRFKESFCTGFSCAVAHRLEEQHRKAMDQSQNTQALIFIGDKLADTNSWIKDNLETYEKKPKSLRSRISEEGFAQGVRRGNEVALTHKTVESQPALF